MLYKIIVKKKRKFFWLSKQADEVYTVGKFNKAFRYSKCCGLLPKKTSSIKNLCDYFFDSLPNNTDTTAPPCRRRIKQICIHFSVFVLMASSHIKNILKSESHKEFANWLTKDTISSSSIYHFNRSILNQKNISLNCVIMTNSGKWLEH